MRSLQAWDLHVQLPARPGSCRFPASHPCRGLSEQGPDGPTPPGREAQPRPRRSPQPEGQTDATLPSLPGVLGFPGMEAGASHSDASAGRSQEPRDAEGARGGPPRERSQAGRPRDRPGPVMETFGGKRARRGKTPAWRRVARRSRGSALRAGEAPRPPPPPQHPPHTHLSAAQPRPP